MACRVKLLLPAGGKFSGMIGLMACSEAVMVIQEAELHLSRPIEIVIFTASEGSRFFPPLIGSGVASGVLPYADVRYRQDQKYVPFHRDVKEVETKQHYIPKGRLAKRTPSLPAAYVEVQVDAFDQDVSTITNDTVGILTGTYGARWYTIELEGDAGETGSFTATTRRDPVLCAASLLDKLEQELSTWEHAAQQSLGLPRDSQTRWSATPFTSFNASPGAVCKTLSFMV